jgi:hypothetical protein
VEVIAVGRYLYLNQDQDIGTLYKVTPQECHSEPFDGVYPEFIEGLRTGFAKLTIGSVEGFTAVCRCMKRLFLGSLSLCGRGTG